MKIIYSIILTAFLFGTSVNFYGQQKSNDLLSQISEEVNQDSLTSYISFLQNFGTRYALADNRKEVALWIKHKFESFGYQNVMLDSFLFERNGQVTMQYNVVCKSDSIYVHDKYVLLGAHHDAITYSSPMDSTPGADDNASGVAGVIETARIMKIYGGNMKIPFHFATWAAEEFGLIGSKHYVQTHLLEDDLPEFYINLDMIANSTNGNREVNSTVTGGLNYLLNIATDYSEVIPVSDPISGGSDHMSFTAEGIPVLFFAESDFSEHYHSNQDRLEYLEMDYAKEVVKATVAAYYFGANANPLVEIKYLLNGGSGDDFIVGWEPQEEAIAYRLDIFQNGNLIRTMETENDSLYVDGLPANQEIYFDLYSLGEDSLGGFRMHQFIQLSETPDPLVLSSEMDEDDIIISWSRPLPMDANLVLVERKPKGENEFEFYGQMASNLGKLEILNHQPGIWEYQLSLLDENDNVSEPASIIVYATQKKDDIMVVSGQLGGYDNPTSSDVLDFYETILPMKDYYLFSVPADNKYLPIMQNMEVVIWNSFSSNYSKFYDNLDLIRNYIENGGKMIFFGTNPQLHFEPDHPDGLAFDPESLVYNIGITNILENDGARLKQLLHISGVSADVDPDKVFVNFNGTLPNVDALVVNENASVVLTYQSLSETVPENNFDDEPIAIKHENGNSIFITCGVPLYYFKEDESKVLLKKLLEDEMMVGQSNVIAFANSIEIFPNPVQNSLNVKNLTGDRISGIFKLNDITGRAVGQFEMDIDPGASNVFNLNLLPGIYFLSNDLLSIKQKLIVE